MTTSHKTKLGEHSWLFNSIDPFVVCDHQAEIVAAFNAAQAGLASGAGALEALGLGYAALARHIPPARWAFHRQLVLGKAMVDGMMALKALQEGKITPAESNEGLMEGLIFNYDPFCEAVGRSLGRLVGGDSKGSESTTSSPDTSATG